MGLRRGPAKGALAGCVEREGEARLCGGVLGAYKPQVPAAIAPQVEERSKGVDTLLAGFAGPPHSSQVKT